MSSHGEGEGGWAYRDRSPLPGRLVCGSVVGVTPKMRFCGARQGIWGRQELTTSTQTQQLLRYSLWLCTISRGGIPQSRGSQVSVLVTWWVSGVVNKGVKTTGGDEERKWSEQKRASEWRYSTSSRADKGMARDLSTSSQHQGGHQRVQRARLHFV